VDLESDQAAVVQGAAVEAEEGYLGALEGGLDYLAGLARVGPVELRAPGDYSDRPELVASSAGAAAWFGGEPSEASGGPSRHAANEAHLRRGIERLEALLAGDFARRAPAEVVERERERLADLEAELVDGDLAARVLLANSIEADHGFQR